MSAENDKIDEILKRGPLGRFFGYARMSGPGWLQGAITLGGGSLAGALYLGVIAGFGLMWLQPLAMICGVIMLSAIAYVTLSTGKRPFHEINTHLNPLLGWSWLVATIMANIVWTMPQFSLATAAIQQNLFSESVPTGLIIVLLFVVGLFVNHLYQSEGRGAKAFDLIIKVMVGIIVLSFFAVVFTLTTSGRLDWGAVFAGYIPDFSLLFKPAAGFTELIEGSSDPKFWKDYISSEQQNRIIAAFGTAVGINMTFLLPYSLLRKRWGAKHRGLSITDLSIGLFVPFMLATSCVVIAAASSFHLQTGDLPEGAGADTLQKVPAVKTAIAEYTEANPEDPDGLADFVSGQLSGLPESDHQLAGMLVGRDANALAVTLEPFAGEAIAQKIFGIGVLGMALSTIIILMLMNGVAFQEAFSRRPKPDQPLNPSAGENKKLYYLGCTISGLAGCCFPLLWAGKAKAALAIPTSVIGGSLIPIAYLTFLLMMNSRSILGDRRPTGGARVIWNCLMIFATSVATFGSVWVLQAKSEAPGWKGMVGWFGLIFLALLFIVGLVAFFKDEKKSA